MCILEYVRIVMKDFSHALFLVADNETNNKGDIGNKYSYGEVIPYETELISCVHSWRTLAGNYKDIPIYIFCPTKIGISKYTQDVISKYNCTYIHQYLPEVEDFNCGYWNVPLSGSYYEKYIKEDIIIHIDLDMSVIKNIPSSLFKLQDNVKAKLGINEYNPTARYPEFTGTIYPFETNTGFIVSRNDSNFYSEWYDRLKILTDTLSIDDPMYSIYEERVLDIMYFDEGYPIDFIKNYQVNGDVSGYTNQEILDLCFFHGHSNMKERNEKNLHLYTKRLLKCLRD